MMKTGLVCDPRLQAHDTGPGHPERPQRLERLRRAFAETQLDQACIPIQPVPIDMRLVESNHDKAYLERLASACADGKPHIDAPDSTICPASFTVAKLAAGAVVRAVQGVVEGTLDNAFCAVRPPGHHAERQMSMGFCLLNNIAIAARFLLAEHNLSRVLILDWDVHHGNGTQHSFEDDPRVLFVSIHGDPRFVYPGSGYEHERGCDLGEGYTLNVPVLPGSGDSEYRRAFEEKIGPAIDGYRPEFILVSAGFDAHEADPLAPIELETSSFAWMTDFVMDAARRHCDGRLVCVLEGGYDLTALGECVVQHVSRLLGRR